MENDNEALDTELETELDSQDETEADTSSSPGDSDAADESASGEDSTSSDSDAAPKSLAEALSAGIDSVTKKGQQPADKTSSDGKDGKTDADKGDPKKQDTADGKQKDGQAAGDGKDGKGGQKVDHVNDPIDARLAPRTQERIRSLVDTVKSRETELAEWKTIAENNGAMVGAIMDTGASPEEFGALVGYLAAVHSEDPTKLEAAYTLLQSELQGLALRMGKPLPEVDWLTGHQDLIDGLRAGTMTRDVAIELAMNRSQRQRAQAQATVKANKTKADGDAAAQAQQDANTAVAELDALGTELAASDPLYQAKYDLIVPKLQAEFKTVPPSQWKTKFLEAYARVKVTPKAPAAAPIKVNTPKPQPLRPSTPSGDTKKAPGSALDALSSAIDGMRG